MFQNIVLVPCTVSNLQGIVTRSTWIPRRKGVLQKASDYLAGRQVEDGQKLVDWQFITSEDRSDVHKLDNTHSQMLEYIGPYLRVNVDLSAPGGQEYAHRLINMPIVFHETQVDGSVRTHFGGRKWYFAGWYFQKNMFVAIMTARPNQNIFDLSGTDVTIGSRQAALAACKRIRRTFAHNRYFFDGTVVETKQHTMPYVTRDGVRSNVKATSLLVEFPLQDGATFRGWARIMHLTHEQMFCLDGQQQADPRRMNVLIQDKYPDVEKLRQGSGFKGTVAYSGGTFKGHTHCLDLGGNLEDTLMLLFDTKTEFRLNGNRFTIGILDMIHHSRQVCTEPQMISNFLLGAADQIQRWNSQWLDDISDSLKDHNKLKALFCTIAKSAILPTTEDVVEADPNKRAGRFVLGTVYRESERKWVSGTFGVTVGGIDVDPTNHPALLRKVYYYATNELMNLDDLRIPIPANVATRRMMMVDPTVCGEGDGIYLDRAVLLGNTVWMDGYEGDLFLTRQPSTPPEVWKAQGVNGGRHFEKFRGTPFIYLSVDGILAVGRTKGSLGTLGGADQDDPAIVWFGVEIVQYFDTVVMAKVIEYNKLDGELIQDVEHYGQRKYGRLAGLAKSKSDEARFMGYSHRSTIFDLIEKACNTNTNIGVAVNPCIIFAVLAWYGMLDGVPNMAIVTNNLERIIDAFQKTGESLPWLSEVLDKFKNELPRVPRFVANRISNYTKDQRAKKGNPIEVIETPFDAVLDAMRAEKDSLDKEIEKYCQDRTMFEGANYEYVSAFLPSEEAVAYASEMRASYRGMFEQTKAQMLDALNELPAFDGLGVAEKERLTGAQASRAAAKHVFQHYVREPLANGQMEKTAILEAVLALYRRVYSANNNFAPSDAMLWGEEFHVVVLEALRYARFLDENRVTV